MRILMFDMGSYTFQDTKEAVEKLGHIVEPIYYHFTNRFNDDFFCERFDYELKKNNYDCILSINFFPLIALAAKEHGIPYISWCYDSPLAEQLTEYFGFDTNIIYLFDQVEVDGYQARGFTNVHHLPLAINADRINKLHFSEEIQRKYSSEISFIGKIYDSQLDNLLLCAPDYIKGYVEGLFQSQFRVYGYNFLEETISDEIIDMLNIEYSKYGTTNIKLNKRGLAYAINSQITHFERTVLLEALAENHNVNFFTADKPQLDKVTVRGPVKYFTEMNAVFQNSLLNLCPTLKSISSGIPLRALDILGAGGVLFSNFQPELAEYFSDGENVIMYESIEDSICKANYYLNNRTLLSSIASNGNELVKKYFNYSDRVKQLLILN